jgi:hypothetical protein
MVALIAYRPVSGLAESPLQPLQGTYLLVTRLRDRNAYLESELKLQEQHLTNALKGNIVLKQQLVVKPAKLR